VAVGRRVILVEHGVRAKRLPSEQAEAMSTMPPTHVPTIFGFWPSPTKNMPRLSHALTQLPELLERPERTRTDQPAAGSQIFSAKNVTPQVIVRATTYAAEVHGEQPAADSDEESLSSKMSFSFLASLSFGHCPPVVTCSFPFSGSDQ